MVESRAMRSPTFSTVRNQFNTWLALWLMLAMLGQATVPTLASMRSNLNPGLWDEICSVYGVRQNTQKPTDQMPTHHAECALCLQMVYDTILDAPAVAVSFQLLLINYLSPPAPVRHLFSRRAAVQEARGPPYFN